MQADVGGHILEFVMAHVLIQDRVLETVRVQVAEKRVLQADVGAVWSASVAGVPADVADEQIDETVVVVIEEHSAGGMRRQADAPVFRDVAEMPMAVVL